MGMLDYGIKAVIAESFSDIFASNAFKNGLLTVDLPAQIIQTLLTVTQSETLLIDLAEQRIQSSHGIIVSFDILPFRKSYLLGGLDEIALTLLLADDIASFERSRAARTPWVETTMQHLSLAVLVHEHVTDGATQSGA